MRFKNEIRQHFSIRKLSVGAASVLIGLSFLGFSAHTVNADEATTAKDQAVLVAKAEHSEDMQKITKESKAAVSADAQEDQKVTNAQNRSTQETTNQTAAGQDQVEQPVSWDAAKSVEVAKKVDKKDETAQPNDKNAANTDKQALKVDKTEQPISKNEIKDEKKDVPALRETTPAWSLDDWQVTIT